MHILILGAAGMIGRKLTAKLVEHGRLGGVPIEALTLVDIIAPPLPAGAMRGVESHAADISVAATAAAAISGRPDIIFHLAAVVSGEAEADFEKGYSINLDGTRHLFEAIRAAHEISFYRPRLVFSSSVAVFGAPLPDVIEDDFALTPLTSYGTQKAIGELLLADYTRRGFIDGIGIRLPTICVRPGKPNRAASGFFSSIIREPLAGLPAILPVPETIRHWFASPKAAIEALIHAASIDLAPLGARRNITLPGLSVSVAEQIAALERVAGAQATRLIERRPDVAIAQMIGGWARAFAPLHAEGLGFTADASFDEIIRIYIEDELK
jgi:nucleoside-diphosphate-sugar epimerase